MPVFHDGQAGAGGRDDEFMKLVGTGSGTPTPGALKN
jgi:hypothetical protein